MSRSINIGVSRFKRISICIFRSIIAIFFCCLFFTTEQLYSQGLHTSSNSAVKSYNQAMSDYNYLEFTSAEALFLKAIDTDPRFYEAHMMLGELYYKQNKFKAAAEYYL